MSVCFYVHKITRVYGRFWLMSHFYYNNVYAQSILLGDKLFSKTIKSVLFDKNTHLLL